MSDLIPLDEERGEFRITEAMLANMPVHGYQLEDVIFAEARARGLQCAIDYFPGLGEWWVRWQPNL